LPLVARYADACNLFDLAPPFDLDIGRKLNVLRQLCEDVGRDEREIEKTTLTPFDLTSGRVQGLRALFSHLEELAALGIDHVILIGPTFEWGDDLDAILSVVDDIHALAV
jgi:hypothetical protein